MPAFSRVHCRRGAHGAACHGLPRRRSHHSPTGYEWGSGGSGPADLALNILAALMPRRDPNDADCVRLADGSWVSARTWHLHQHLKWELIAHLPREGFTLSRRTSRTGSTPPTPANARSSAAASASARPCTRWPKPTSQTPHAIPPTRTKPIAPRASHTRVSVSPLCTSSAWDRRAPPRGVRALRR